MERLAGASADVRTTALDERLAGAPISWGACEVPGWGVMPDPERVLSEMASVGLRGTELGPPGFFPADPRLLRETLGRHDLEPVGAFVPLVLHHRSLGDAARLARETTTLLADAGARMLVLSIVEDKAWSEPTKLDDDAWRNLAANVEAIEAIAAGDGLTVALHPHVGTLIETGAQVRLALERLDVGWCLDTGHLLIGGTDPVVFVRDHGDRIVHAHLKDIDTTIAARLRSGELSLLSATRQGLFVPLGRGDAGIASVLDALARHGYDGWLVLEQDTAITGEEPPVGREPIVDVRESIAFLHNSALRTQEVN
ncbi:MAG: sugar phosphate isomerase/epimerase family protein [Solirubrobacteraceae bacterium]